MSVSLLVLVVAATMGLVACGDDDDTEVGAPTTEAGGGGDDADIEAYCDAVLQIETAQEPDIDFESSSPEEISEALKIFATDELKGPADEALANAPAEIRSDVEVLVNAVDEIAETGDPDLFESPEVEAAGRTTHAFELENCGWGRADVEMVDYAFEGLEESYDAGPVSFEFSNTGKEQHELVLARKKDGVTESFEELLQLPEEQVGEKVDISFIGFEDPGEEDFKVVELVTGEYLAVCFIPVGSTPEAVAAAEEKGEEIQGPPHIAEGMQAEFSVS